MSNDTKASGWVESMPVRLVVLTLVGAGAYLVWMRAPALAAMAMLGDYWIVILVILMFAYVTAANLLLWMVSSIAGRLTRR
jgi:hypothetical protein